MQPYSFQVRQATKEAAKEQVAAEFDEITATSAPADWAPAQAAANAMIDALEDVSMLDVVAVIEGAVNYVGDRVRNVEISIKSFLTDRIA